MDNGTKKFGEKWHVNPNTVAKWCREGKIPGATQDGKGNPWHIPANAKDPRSKK